MAEEHWDLSKSRSVAQHRLSGPALGMYGAAPSTGHPTQGNPRGSHSQGAVQPFLHKKWSPKTLSVFELNSLILYLRIDGSQIKVRTQRSPFSPWYKTFCVNGTEHIL